ncbi:hypothetical protein D3C81_1002320 [compost metagenome]
MIERSVRLFRICFVPAVIGRFLVQRGKQGACSCEFPVRLFFRYKLKGGHGKGIADFFPCYFITTELRDHAAKQALLIQRRQAFENTICINAQTVIVESELTVVRFIDEGWHRRESLLSK